MDVVVSRSLGGRVLPLDRSLNSFLEIVDRSASFLEIGLGEGRLTALAAVRFARVVAVDNDARVLITARRRVSGRAVSLLQMDAHHLDFPDRMFDAVAEFNALGGFTQPELVVVEMTRVVRPGGTLFFLASWRSEGLILKSGWVQAALGRAGFRFAVVSRGKVGGLVARRPG